MYWADQLRETLAPAHKDPQNEREKLDPAQLQALITDVMRKIGEANGKAQASAIRRTFEGIPDVRAISDED